jgi:GT2 family glycosyltransferase/ubiquinone/menaquinone biosynthesis C-methylase UbiE
MGFYGDCGSCEQSNEPFAWRLSLLNEYCHGGRLLDIGCANGGFLAAAHRAGWECCGVEISAHACRLAEKHPGVRISRGTLAQAKFDDGYFDAVSAGDVLEHMQDPSGFLKEVRRVLKPGGYVYIAVPDFGSLHYRLMRLLCVFTGRNYFVLPHHLVHFTQSALTLALQRQGFGIVKALHTESGRTESGIKRLFMETVAFAGRIFSLRDRLVVVARKESLPRSCSVAAVIVTYRNPGMLAGLLRSLEGQTRAPETVIVIDNSPDNETAEMAAASFPRAEYVHCPENIGSAGGFSFGIERASGRYEFIWMLDDDTELRPDSLERLLWGWFFLPGDRTRAGAVRSWCTYVAPFVWPKETKSFAWRGTLIRSAAVRAIGLPNRDYFLYGDDTEFSFRMRSAGFGIYWIPDSIAVERKRPRGPRKFGRSKLYDSPSRLYYAFRNQVHVFISYRMYINVALTVAYACKVVLAACLRSKDPVCAIFEGLFDGFRGRIGKNAKYTCRGQEGS